MQFHIKSNKVYNNAMFPSVFNTTNKVLIIAISPKILWIGFGVVLVLTIIMSIVLLYHFASYGYKPVKTGIMGSIYVIGAIVILGVMFFAILSYTNSL